MKGRNSGYGVKITTRLEPDEFIHYWGLTKRDFTRTQFVTLRKTPINAAKQYAAGFFINSGDGQVTEMLEEELSKMVGFRVGMAYRPAALDKRTADAMWKRAKKARSKAPDYDKGRVFFKYAPLVLQLYCATREQAVKAAATFSQQFGKITEDGQYPRLPDGTRMRFIAAHIYLDMQGKATAATLFNQQIQFQSTEVIAPIPIRDPYQRFATQGNKTMHELCMDLQDSEQMNEPYFRYMKRRFHWNYKTKEWEVSIHSNMYPAAAKILRNFKHYMTSMYGDEVGDAILDVDNTKITTDVDTTTGSYSGISISTDDRYLNGSAQFIIEGLENVNIKDSETPGEIRKGDGDEPTMQIRSTASGFTGHTGQTVPQGGYMDARSTTPPPNMEGYKTPGRDEICQNTIDGQRQSSERERVTQLKGDPPYGKTTTTMNERSTGEATDGDDDEGWQTVRKGARPRTPLAGDLVATTLSLQGKTEENGP